jgi:hypothetical protein
LTLAVVRIVVTRRPDDDEEDADDDVDVAVADGTP